MLLSIIIPVYNSQKYILDCLKSCNIDSNNYEVIIINDGSTDESENIILNYIRDKEQYIYHYQINSGVSSARNKGIEIAKGDYVFFLDSDDKILNLNLLLKKEYKDDLYIFSYKKTYQKLWNRPKLVNKVINISREDFIANYYYNYVQTRNYVWGKIIKREIIIKNKISFNPNYNYGEDTLFLSEIIKESKTICIDKIVSYEYNNTNDDNASKLSVQVRNKKSDFINIVVQIIHSLNCYNKYASSFYLSNLELVLINNINMIPTELINFDKVNSKYKKFYKYLLNDEKEKISIYIKHKQHSIKIRASVKNFIKKLIKR